MKVFLAILLGISTLFLSGCQKRLLGEQSEIDANAIHRILDREKINSEKVKAKKGGLYIVTVDNSDYSNALIILHSRGYPKQTGKAFTTDSLVPTPAEIKMKKRSNLSRNLEKTLLQIDGVLTVKVNIVLPEKNLFDELTKPSRASILIKHHPSIDMSSKKVNIKILVEKSIEGLSYNNISLFTLPAERIRSDSPLLNKEKSIVSYFLIAVLLLLFITFAIAFHKGYRPFPNIRKVSS